jgi:hypothetical protein
MTHKGPTRPARWGCVRLLEALWPRTNASIAKVISGCTVFIARLPLPDRSLQRAPRFRAAHLSILRHSSYNILGHGTDAVR